MSLNRVKGLGIRGMENINLKNFMNFQREARFRPDAGTDNTEIEPEFIENVMTEAYAQVARDYADYMSSKNPQDVFMEDDKCQQVSEAIFYILKKAGIRARYVYVTDREKFKTYGGRQHIYVCVDDRYLLDGTWQSFVDFTNKNQPYLLLDVNDIESGLKNADVPKELWLIWMDYKKYLKKLPN